MGTHNFNTWGSSVTKHHPIQGRAEILLPSRFMQHKGWNKLRADRPHGSYTDYILKPKRLAC